MGGTVASPSYQQVCADNTGHAETVEVVYDTRKLSTRSLLTEFFTLHDFTVDRSESNGQYRSAIFLSPDDKYALEQEETALMLLAILRENGFIPATVLRWEQNFYPAEKRHQKYCLSKGVVPEKRNTEAVRKILTL